MHVLNILVFANQQDCKSNLPTEKQAIISPGLLGFGVFWGGGVKRLHNFHNPVLSRIQKCVVKSRHLFKSSFFHQWCNNYNIVWWSVLSKQLSKWLTELSIPWLRQQEHLFCSNFGSLFLFSWKKDIGARYLRPPNSMTSSYNNIHSTNHARQWPGCQSQ